MNTPDASKPSGLLPKLPLLLALGLCAFLAMDRVHGNEHMLWSFVGVGGGLIVWFLALSFSGRSMAVEAMRPVKQHYIQASVQIVLYAYWGYHWVVGSSHPMFEQAPLVLAQFFFLYAFDALWSWTRGRSWRFSSGPTPIVLSTNLFIWFKDDWFIWQFAMITAGLLGKEFIRWTKDGRKTHIFNPSGFGLACAATVLIATDSTDLTWAKPLSTTLDVDYMFLVLFALGLVVQYCFAVTLMTFAAALAMLVSNLLYTEITGVYLFASQNLPAAAFLGLLLLMTDPSTSPRTNVGRTLFGLGYGFGYVVMFEILGAMGAPELFAKLYPVPILNCTIQFLDRFARSGAVGRLNERWENGFSKQKSNGIHIGLWAIVFVVMLATDYVPWGKKVDQVRHPGDSIAFWRQAVVDGKYDAERKLVMVAGTQAVAGGSPQAFNELGILSMTSSVDDASELTRRRTAASWFAQGAERGNVAASKNLFLMFLFHHVHRSDQDLIAAMNVCKMQVKEHKDPLSAVLLGVASEVGRAMELNPREALSYYQLCPPGDVDAQKGIARIALRHAAGIKLDKAAPVLRAAVEAGDGECAFYLAHMYLVGNGVKKDAALAETMAKRAASLGFQPAIDSVRAGKMPPFATPALKHMTPPAFASDVL